MLNKKTNFLFDFTFSFRFYVTLLANDFTTVFSWRLCY